MSASSQSSSEPEPVAPSITIVVDASRPDTWFDWKEIWRYHELIWILAARDIKVRYRQAVVGVAWVVLQPLAQMVVFAGLFRLLKTQPVEPGTSSSLSIFCGLMLWQLFDAIVRTATSCLVDNRQILTKVYFPRIILPLSACVRPLVDFGVCSLVLITMLFWHQIVPTTALLMLPIIVLMTLLAALSLGLWLSALNAQYRDFGYIVPFVLHLGQFISPVVYESKALIPNEWRPVYFLNPVASLLEAFRGCIFGRLDLNLLDMLLSFSVTLFVLVSGAWYFRRVERFLADSV